jgi:hypothetical protein
VEAGVADVDAVLRLDCEEDVGEAAASRHRVGEPFVLVGHRQRVAATLEEARHLAVVHPPVAALEVVGLQCPQRYELTFEHVASS